MNMEETRGEKKLKQTNSNKQTQTNKLKQTNSNKQTQRSKLKQTNSNKQTRTNKLKQTNANKQTSITSMHMSIRGFSAYQHMLVVVGIFAISTQVLVFAFFAFFACSSIASMHAFHASFFVFVLPHPLDFSVYLSPLTFRHLNILLPWTVYTTPPR